MTNKKKDIYTKESIKSLSPRDFTRLRPGVYCGSTEYSTQLVKELFANALDEHNIGHGNLIEVGVSENNLYTITDQGQGFPVNSKREDNTTVLEASFSILNTSGKYDEDGVYGASALGLNGIGAKLATYLSKKLLVSTTQSGTTECEVIEFRDGIFYKREIKKVSKESHGTSIQFIPDEQFFDHPEADFKELADLFKEISALCPTLTIKFNVHGKEQVFHSKNGLNDLIDERAKGKEIIKNRFRSRLEDKDNLFDICMTYTTDYSDNVTAYVNYGLTDNGVHLTTLKSGLTRAFNKYATENGLFKKGEANLTGVELSEGQVIIFNLKAPGVKYDSQTKTRVVDVDKTLISETINNSFATWLEANPKDAKIIIEKALQARRAREAAKKAREAVRKPTKEKNNLKARIAICDKLKDANGKNRGNCELFLTEGNSAAGSAIAARDVETQAIMALRGKVLNAEKTDVTKMLENKEISGIISAIGAGFGADFDVRKSRYGKVILLTDADVDGSHIQILLLTFLFKYMRPLIEKGMVYVATPPLYRIVKGNNYLYLQDDRALEDYKKKNKNFEIQRFKGSIWSLRTFPTL